MLNTRRIVSTRCFCFISTLMQGNIRQLNFMKIIGLGQYSEIWYLSPTLQYQRLKFDTHLPRGDTVI